jgi:hypothetical protein
MFSGADRSSGDSSSGRGEIRPAPDGNVTRAQSIYEAASPAGAASSRGGAAPPVPLPFYKFVNIPGSGSGVPPGTVPEESCAGKIVSGAVLG